MRRTLGEQNISPGKWPHGGIVGLRFAIVKIRLRFFLPGSRPSASFSEPDFRRGGAEMNVPVREQLLASSDEFRKLADEHSNYSQRLESLANKKYPSEEDKIEEIRLKKLKLRLKNRFGYIER